jgi:hypothetical protein
MNLSDSFKLRKISISCRNFRKINIIIKKYFDFLFNFNELKIWLEYF